MAGVPTSTPLGQNGSFKPEWVLFFTQLISSGQKLYPTSDAGDVQDYAAITAGSGAPADANGANGDVYFRSDGAALTTIYQKRAGAWVGIA